MGNTSILIINPSDNPAVLLSTCSFQQIPPAAIDHEDQQYRLAPSSAEEIPAELVTSIREVGILQPPLVQKKDNNQHIIVAGAKRIRVAGELFSATPIPCLVVPQEVPPATIFTLLAHHLRWATTPPTIIELATFLKKASLRTSAAETRHLLPLFALPAHDHTLSEITALLDLEPSTVAALHAGSLHAKAGRRLARLTTEEQKELCGIITELRLGGSKQQKLIDLCLELRGRGEESLTSLMAQWREECQQGPDPENKPQNGLLLFRRLQSQCSPRATAAAESFKRFVAGLNLPAQATVQPAPYFESDETVLTLTFPDQEQLRDFWLKKSSKALP